VKQFLAPVFALFIFCSTHSQTDSCRLRLSLLTCSPGQELYSLFGHSALRLIDSSYGIDIIFNYGTFNFDDPDFYAKFGRGNMLYYVSVETMNDFAEQYRYEKRSITEQLLSLSCSEKEKLSAFLKENTKEENKYYLYNFLFDNCSSRLKDIVEKNTADPLQFQNILPSQSTTFRNLIHEYLDKGHQPWTKLGLDLLLGSALDVAVKNEQALFLPEYLMKAFDNGKTGNKKLVSNKQLVLSVESPIEESRLPQPLVFFTLLLVLVAGVSLLKSNWSNPILRIFDFVLFFTAGLTGLTWYGLFLFIFSWHFLYSVKNRG
jgi:Domain of unknown function (DUF4105)